MVRLNNLLTSMCLLFIIEPVIKDYVLSLSVVNRLMYGVILFWILMKVSDILNGGNKST